MEDRSDAARMMQPGAKHVFYERSAFRSNVQERQLSQRTSSGAVVGIGAGTTTVVVAAVVVVEMVVLVEIPMLVVV